jgi:hypothetical protein
LHQKSIDTLRRAQIGGKPPLSTIKRTLWLKIILIFNPKRRDIDANHWAIEIFFRINQPLKGFLEANYATIFRMLGISCFHRLISGFLRWFHFDHELLGTKAPLPSGNETPNKSFISPAT